MTSSRPIGYAAVDGMTTGGEGGQVVTVSSLSALKSAAGSSSKMIIQVSGVIKGDDRVTVKSNKTIVGLKGSALEGIGLNMYTVSNIIVRNLTMRGITHLGDAITIKNRAHHIWIDHCDLSIGSRGDGILDITEQSDYVTVSWTKISGSSRASLVGGSDNSTADANFLRVTYHHNYFVNNTERQPSVRFGRAHVFNNYIKDTRTGGYGVASRMGAIVRVERNYFENVQSWPLQTIGPVEGFFSGVDTNRFIRSGTIKIRSSASNWEPNYDYDHVLLPVDQVPAAVLQGVGPKF